MASHWEEGCFEAVTATSTHCIKKLGAVRAEEGVLLAVGVGQDGRDVELAGGDAAVLMTLEVDEVARHSINRKVGLGGRVDSLVHHF